MLRSGVPKRLDLASEDNRFVGDAKYYKDLAVPAAKFSTISEYVWLLQNVPNAGHRFLVFGRDRAVPIRWLARFARLAEDVAFYFLDDDGRLIDLKAR